MQAVGLSHLRRGQAREQAAVVELIQYRPEGTAVTRPHEMLSTEVHRSCRISRVGRRSIQMRSKSAGQFYTIRYRYSEMGKGSGRAERLCCVGGTGGLRTSYDVLTNAYFCKPPVPTAATGRGHRISDRREMPGPILLEDCEGHEPVVAVRLGDDQVVQGGYLVVGQGHGGLAPPPARGREFGATTRAAGARELLVVAGPAGVASRRCIVPRSHPTRVSHRGRTGWCGGAEDKPLRGQYGGGRGPGGDARVTRQRGGRCAARRREDSVGVNLI